MLQLRCISLGLAVCIPHLLSAQALEPKTHREAVARAAEIFEAKGTDLSAFRIKSAFLRDAFVVELFPDPGEFNGAMPPKVPSIASVSFGYESKWEPVFNSPKFEMVRGHGYGKALAAAMRYRAVKNGGQGWPVDSIFKIRGSEGGTVWIGEQRLPAMVGAHTVYQVDKNFVVVRVTGGK